MKKKHFLIVLLVALLLPTTLFAQGSKATAAEDAVQYTPAGTFPIVESPITVDIMVAQPPCVEDYNTNRFTKYMEELTGVKVNYIMIPSRQPPRNLPWFWPVATIRTHSWALQ